MQNTTKSQGIIVLKDKLKKIKNIIQNALKDTKKLMRIFYLRMRPSTQSLSALKDVALAVLTLIISGVFSSACFPLGIYPLGFTTIAISSRYAFFAFTGAAIASIFYRGYGLIYFFTYLCFYIFRMVITKGVLKEKRSIRIAQSGVFAFICGILSYVFGGFLNFELFATFSLCLCTLFSSLLLAGACDRFFEGKKVDSSKVEAGVVTFCVMLCFSLKSFSIGNVSVALVLSAFATLCASKCPDSLYGGAVGLICGISASASPKAALMLSAGGIACGLWAKKGKLACGVGFVCGAVCCGAYVGGIDVFSKYMPEFLIGLLLFLPLHDSISQSFEKQNTKTVQGVSPYSADKNLKGLSGAFSSLSDVFFKMSDKMKYPAAEDIEKITVDAFEQTCKSCSMQDMCICRQSYCEDLPKEIFEVLRESKLNVDDFPKLYSVNCIKIDKICDYINDKYKSYVSEYFKTNKTEILASQYSAMARVIRCTAEKSKGEIQRDEKLENTASMCLDKIGIKHSCVRACGVRNRVIEVFGVNIEKIPCSARELAEYMSRNCGIYLTEPEFVGDKNGFIMRFYCRKKINLEYAKASKAKGQSDINGDTTTFFENDEGFFYALISDGMGSGRDAALTSRLTSVFIEKLLTTGAHKSVTLELLNNLLLAKNDECFATVDLLEVDMLEGKASFIKAGAAPAYIIRSTKLYKIASNTPPAGIIECFTAQNTKFTLCDGDIILMLSDGIIESFDDSPWLCELMDFDPKDDISQLCERIIDKAVSLCVRDDDMSVVAARVVRN